MAVTGAILESRLDSADFGGARGGFTVEHHAAGLLTGLKPTETARFTWQPGANSHQPSADSLQLFRADGRP
jgi:hypothetical protein